MTPLQGRPQGYASISVNVTFMTVCHCEGDRKGTLLLYTMKLRQRPVYSRGWACPCPRLIYPSPPQAARKNNAEKTFEVMYENTGQQDQPGL